MQVLYSDFLAEVRRDGPSSRAQLQMASKHSSSLVQRYQAGLAFGCRGAGSLGSGRGTMVGVEVGGLSSLVQLCQVGADWVGVRGDRGSGVVSAWVSEWVNSGM